MFSVVLYQPEIPGNTGNIGRLCVNIGANLHLIKPLGFDIDMKSIRRAGLDYWQHLSLTTWDNYKSFSDSNSSKNVYYFSTKAKRDFWSADYKSGDFYVFGPETRGLPEDLIDNNVENSYKIPMFSDNARSFNLANSVAIVAYEAIRKIRRN